MSSFLVIGYVVLYTIISILSAAGILFFYLICEMHYLYHKNKKIKEELLRQEQKLIMLSQHYYLLLAKITNAFSEIDDLFYRISGLPSPPINRK